MRVLPNKLFEKTSSAVKDKVGGFIFHKGNDSFFWLQNLWWQVEHSEATVMMQNFVHLMAFIENQGWGISPKRYWSTSIPFCGRTIPS